MVSYNDTFRQFQLSVDEPILRRLSLLTLDGTPLIMLHADRQLLADLEAEILGRYRLREGSHRRAKRLEYLQAGTFGAILVVQMVLSVYYKDLFSQWSLSSTAVNLLFTGGLVAVYGVIYLLFLRNGPQTDPSTAVLEDQLLRTWIIQHCAA